MATGPDLRIGDADREHAAADLREHFAQGRLTLDEFNERVDAVFAAATQSQLRRVSSDLPHSTAAAAATPLPVSDRQQYPGDGGRGYSRQRSRRLVTGAAAMLLMMFVFISLLPGPFGLFRVGPIGIMLLIFGMVRGLLRRAGRGYPGRGNGGWYGRPGRGRPWK